MRSAGQAEGTRARSAAAADALRSCCRSVDALQKRCGCFPNRDEGDGGEGGVGGRGAHSKSLSALTLLSTSMIFEPASSCITSPLVTMGLIPSSMQVPLFDAMMTRAQ